MPFTPQTVQTMTQSVFQSGTHDGDQIAWPAGALAVIAQGVLSGPDLADTSKECDIAILLSFDGGLTWQQAQTSMWQGGQFLHDGVTPKPPSAGTNWIAGGTLPTHVSTRIMLPAPLSIGAELLFS